MVWLTGRLLWSAPPWAVAVVCRSAAVLVLRHTVGEGGATGRQGSASQTRGEVSWWQWLAGGGFCCGSTMDEAGELTVAAQEGTVGRHERAGA